MLFSACSRTQHHRPKYASCASIKCPHRSSNAFQLIKLLSRHPSARSLSHYEPGKAAVLLPLRTRPPLEMLRPLRTRLKCPVVQVRTRIRIRSGHEFAKAQMSMRTRKWCTRRKIGRSRLWLTTFKRQAVFEARAFHLRFIFLPGHAHDLADAAAFLQASPYRPLISETVVDATCILKELKLPGVASVAPPNKSHAETRTHNRESINRCTRTTISSHRLATSTLWRLDATRRKRALPLRFTSSPAWSQRKNVNGPCTLHQWSVLPQLENIEIPTLFNMNEKSGSYFSFPLFHYPFLAPSPHRNCSGHN